MIIIWQPEIEPKAFTGLHEFGSVVFADFHRSQSWSELLRDAVHAD
jgi:hypothetical protein